MTDTKTTPDSAIEDALRSVEQGTPATLASAPTEPALAAPPSAELPAPTPPPSAPPAPVVAAAAGPAQEATPPAAGPPAAPATPPQATTPPVAEVPAKRPQAAVALAPVSDQNAQAEIKKLREMVLEVRQALRQREAELEVSQEMGRDTLGKLKDQHQRTLLAMADLDNHKKRVAKERDETAKFGQEKMLRDFLPVMDNFERALEAAKSPADYEGLRLGLQMTRKLFEDTLGRYGVKGFSSLNETFDPHVHEAIQSMESDAPPNTVILEIVRGYKLHDRLMRPAMVAVSKPRASPAAKPEEPAPAAAAEAVVTEETK